MSSTHGLCAPPCLAPRLGEVNPAHEHRPLLCVDRGFGLSPRILRPAKASLFEPPGTDPQSAPIPEKDLESGPRTIAEQEEMAGKRVRLQPRSDQAIEAVEAFAHVCRSHRQVDLRGAADPKHQLTS